VCYLLEQLRPSSHKTTSESFSDLMDPIPAAARSNVWVFSRSFAGIADSNPAGDMDVCLLRLFCVVR